MGGRIVNIASQRRIRFPARAGLYIVQTRLVGLVSASGRHRNSAAHGITVN